MDTRECAVRVPLAPPFMYTLVGTFDRNKAGHSEEYFKERYTFLDCRGRLKISPLSNWGYNNTIVAATHDISSGQFAVPMNFVDVVVEDYAWITSNCILYNCYIMHHGIVAIGAVVSGATVEPYTIVAGNPARVISRWNGKEWEVTDE
jgi:acetyltransferase-like isoleucine patch superfamily enzyme